MRRTGSSAVAGLADSTCHAARSSRTPRSLLLQADPTRVGPQIKHLTCFFPVRRIQRTFAFAPTVVHGDFEWDEAKAASNTAKHGVGFEEAALAMRDPLSQDFDDGLHPANLVTLAASPSGRIPYVVSTD